MATAIIRASRRVGVLDYFRVPHEVSEEPPVEGVHQLKMEPNGPALFWSSGRRGQPIGGTLVTGDNNDAAIPIFGQILPDDEAVTVLAVIGGEWSRGRSIIDPDGHRVGSVWRRRDSSVFLPYDPDEIVENCRTEAYSSVSSSRVSRALTAQVRRAYYGIRPLLPRPAQIWLRRKFTGIQKRSRFPRWPAESALHDFSDLFCADLATVIGRPVPRIAAWPYGRGWAFVVTHDVETDVGYSAVAPVLELERALGIRSAWYYVPRRYTVALEDLRRLVDQGLEVGVHGLYHDGRDLGSLALLQKRLPGIREAADSWGAVGFRSPALHRRWEWMPLLGFDYDSSYPDTDPYEPMPGGCCSWLPFFIGDVVELPITLPQDHTLFTILRQDDETIWVRKAELLRARGGMVLMDTHPDYLTDEDTFTAYGRFLQQFVGDTSAWHALPHEVSSWWRRRSASHLEPNGDGWRVVGPAADEASVEYVQPSCDRHI
jgi:hypothetical protein